MADDAGAERKDQLDSKELDGEVTDLFVDYKQEAIKAFVNILEQGPEAEAVPGTPDQQ
jgi:hypothetical protein